MRSLRSRLILGFSFLAVVPLGLAMVLLTGRIEEMVRAQAAERLTAALGSLQAEVESDGRRIAEKLAILARDPQLKRLYLLKPTGSRDLTDYLTERAFLLGLDFLTVGSTGGTVVAEASAATGSAGSGAPRAEPESQEGPHGPAIEPLVGGTGLAMAASVPIRYQNEDAGLLHGGLIFDAAFLARLGKANGIQLLLRDAEGRVVAATLPVAGEHAPPADSAVTRVRAAGRSYLSESFPLTIGAAPLATVTGLVPTDPADRAILSLEITSALLGALGLGIAVFLAVLWSSQVSRPVERLARYSHKLAQGEWDEPLALRSVREIEMLGAALDRMRRDLTAYRARLVVSERQSAWSDMARKVAHEIKNPLTPIAVSVADLKRSYELERADFPQILEQAVRTIAEEVDTLKRLLSEFSDFARLPAPQLKPCPVAGLLRDLGTLYGRDVAEGRLRIRPAAEEARILADAGQIRQVLVNLVRNGFEAAGPQGHVTISAEPGDAELLLRVADTGPGLGAAQRARLFTPGFTTKAEGSGLGLTIAQRIVNDHRGTITVESEPGQGTVFLVRLPLAPEA